MDASRVDDSTRVDSTDQGVVMRPDSPSSDEDNGFFECPPPPASFSLDQNPHLNFPAEFIHARQAQQKPSSVNDDSSTGAFTHHQDGHSECMCDVHQAASRRCVRDIRNAGHPAAYLHRRWRDDSSDEAESGNEQDMWLVTSQLNGQGPCDDMDSYLNENAHLLSELDIAESPGQHCQAACNGDQTGLPCNNGVDGPGGSSSFLVNPSDASAVRYEWNGAHKHWQSDQDRGAGGLYLPHRTSASVQNDCNDDHGDFIEADFSRTNHSTFLGLADSKESSYEDLSNLDLDWQNSANTNPAGDLNSCVFNQDVSAECSSNGAFRDGRVETVNKSFSETNNTRTDSALQQNNLDLELFVTSECRNCKHCQNGAAWRNERETVAKEGSFNAITPDSSAYMSPDMDYFDIDSELDSGQEMISEERKTGQNNRTVEREDLNIRGSDTNDLNEVFTFEPPGSDHEDELLNVSRQTSTSNFDQDENSYQDNLVGLYSYDLESEYIVSNHGHCETEARQMMKQHSSASDGDNFSNDTDHAGDGEELTYHSPRAVLPQQPSLHSIAPLLDFVNAANDEYLNDSENEEENAEEHIYEDLDSVPCCSGTEKAEFREEIPDHGNSERNMDEQLQERRSSAGVGVSKTQMEKVMIWSEYEAYVLQVKQIGTSACGPTAVINVLKAFDIFPEKDEVCQMIVTNLRAELADAGEYLISRSRAGTTADELSRGIEQITNGAVAGHFFSFYPQRDVDLRRWLAKWMKKGAVALATLNMQKGVPPDWTIPDAWHHQMIYGVGPKGIYLTNPLEVVPEDIILQQLNSPSELLIRRNDIISRWSETSDLGILLCQEDARWRQMNVLGQVINVMREHYAPRTPGYRPQFVTHVKIPAVYKAGITLFAKTNSKVYAELKNSTQLPLKMEITSNAR